jgi:transposase-like protein
MTGNTVISGFRPPLLSVMEASRAFYCRLSGSIVCAVQSPRHCPELYYSWSKEFLEAGKKRLAGDTAREASSGEVKDLRREARALKEVVAEQTQEIAMQCPDQDPSHRRQPNVLSFSARWRCYPGNPG